MKKITILIALMITSLVFAQPTGTWKFTPAAGAFQVGQTQGSNGYFQNNADDVNIRACQFDDEFVFNADGSFQNVLQGSTWLETWQAATEGCGVPTAPFDGTAVATWAYSGANNTITITGKGAYLGLQKAYNGGELNNLANAVNSITYKVTTLTATNMTLDILVGPTPEGGAWWRFNFTKKIEGQPVIGALNISVAAEGDAPIDIVDPISNSLGSFSYTSNNPAVATISGSTILVGVKGTAKITATQAASPPFISGTKEVNFVVTAADPLAGPTDPIARNAWDVISIYNGIDTPVAPQYTNIPGITFQTFGGTSFVGPKTLADANTVWKYYNHLYSGIQLAATSIDVSAMTMLHMDVYSQDFTTFKIKLEDSTTANNEIEVPFAKVKNAWNSYDIDLSTYSAPDLTKLKFIVPVSFEPPGTTLYIDNVYFYRPATLGVSKFDASGIKMYPNPVQNTLTIEANSEIQRVSVYNVLGQEVLSRSPKSNATTLQTNDLQKGVYMVKTEIDGNVSMRKIVKE